MKDKIKEILPKYNIHGTGIMPITDDGIDAIVNLFEKEERANIEQGMVYLFKQLPMWIIKHRAMSKARKDSLWSNMCIWIDEYNEKLGLRKHV